MNEAVFTEKALTTAVHFPDEVVLQIFQRLHWGDVLQLAHHPVLSRTGWARTASEPFLWPKDLHLAKCTVAQLTRILSLGGQHVRTLKLSQLHLSPASSSQVKTWTVKFEYGNDRFSLSARFVTILNIFPIYPLNYAVNYWVELKAC
jgi:hypothetical protein